MVIEDIVDVANKVRATYDYYKGKRTNKLGNLIPATAAEIRANRTAYKMVQEFSKAKAPYRAEVDREDSKLVITIDARKVPNKLVNRFKKGGTYDKYVNSYDPKSGHVEMIFDIKKLPDRNRYNQDIHTPGGTQAVIAGQNRNESVMNPTPIPYEYKKGVVSRKKTEDEEDLTESSHDYELVDTKLVKDTDGFLTDYSWYKRSDGLNVFVLADRDMIDSPDDAESDWETMSDEEARDWFDGYEGADDMSESIELELKTSGNPFKSTHICDGCGNPIGECTCDIEGIDESKNRRPLIRRRVKESVDFSDPNQVLNYEQAKEYAKMNYRNGGDDFLETWEDYQFADYEEMFGPVTVKDMDALFRLYKSDQDEYSHYRGEDFSSSSCTQSSSVGGYKRDSIDLIPKDCYKEDDEDGE